MTSLPFIPPLTEILDLRDDGGGLFTGPVVQDGRTRIYGGQTAAQALAAASFTVEGGNCHSMHSRFLRAGKPGRAIEYEVTSLADSRRFSARQVMARQRGELLFQLTASFQMDGGTSPDHSTAHQPVTAPDELPDEATQHELIHREVPEALRPHLLRRLSLIHI